MSPSILGIHHVTAIGSDPQRNFDFYSGVLGLRLVKMTVNFDDPGSYHFYYGDGAGSPGTILTFFLWPGARRGRPGSGQVTHTAFAIPPGSLAYWENRLQDAKVAIGKPLDRFGQTALPFMDHDGMRIELIETPDVDSNRTWSGGGVPTASAIHGFHSATITAADPRETSALLVDTLGFRQTGEDTNRLRFEAGQGGAGQSVDILSVPESPAGRIAVGSVHHIAWRAPDDAQQQGWLSKLGDSGYDSSPVMDRTYFHSIYFREPGGVLFEIATDQPGFAVDEALENLGSSLRLPLWLEPQRGTLEEVLPPLNRRVGAVA
ncbi:ring-cleaving dioxygenase [uncultured Paludibaculum sp.]|uniref:ring-cleaving dioxygenase n=1 Tax=uncultured Paludibaculum sp. TaxID=1765020 RepID=UPI002AAB9529|nr:ring-cleaving dioxygenase [uncultured Paludibaculum sp.]